MGDAASRGQGRHLASSLPVHRRAMHGYPGSSVTTQHRAPPSAASRSIHPGAAS